jgi:hypothetical protein
MDHHRGRPLLDVHPAARRVLRGDVKLTRRSPYVAVPGFVADASWDVSEWGDALEQGREAAPFVWRWRNSVC